ncbi:MAG: hypothetical protein U5K75_10920 [Ahrensia sp.]|nr:hypothetical protein [Ahrensia sp.]
MSNIFLAITIAGYLISLKMALHGVLDEPCAKKQRIRTAGVGALAVLSLILGLQLDAIL